MSLYSNEIQYILENTLTPKMTKAVSQLNAIEPYSYDSPELSKRRYNLFYWNAIYDYLYEYYTGAEEVDISDLMSVVRLIGNIDINLQPEDYDPATNAQPQGDIFELFVDGEAFTGEIVVGYHDIEARYNAACYNIKLLHKQKMVGAPGDVVKMQNVYVNGDSTLEVRAYAEGNILLKSAQLIYAASDVIAPAYGPLPHTIIYA